MTNRYESHIAVSARSLSAAAARTDVVPGEDGVWLPVLTVPITFILCVVMYVVLHVG